MCLRHEGFPACTTPTLRGRAPCGDVSVKRRNPGEHRTISQDSRVACSFWCYSNFSSSRNQNITSVVFIHLANHSNPRESLAQTSLNFVLSPSDVAGVDIMFKTSLVGLSRTELLFCFASVPPLYRSQHVRKEPVSSKHTHTHTHDSNTWAQIALHADEAKVNRNCWQSQQGSCLPKLLLVACGRRIKGSPSELTILKAEGLPWFTFLCDLKGSVAIRGRTYRTCTPRPGTTKDSCRSF